MLDHDYWAILNDESELLNDFEQEHEPGQTFDEWIEQSIKYGFIKYGNDGNLYKKI